MKSFALVTISKGRLHHIKQTLPLMVAQQATEVVVVDYGCPDSTGDWVELNYPDVKVVRSEQNAPFCVAAARNLGASIVQSDWIVFVDADIFLDDGFHKWIQEHIEDSNFYRSSMISAEGDWDTWGTAIISRSDFNEIGGYDEVFSGWSGEDTDIYRRLILHGCNECEYPSNFVSAISHSDEERSGWYGLKNRQETLALVNCYVSAKEIAMKELKFKGDLPKEYRIYLMMDLRIKLLKFFRNGGGFQFMVNTDLMHDDRLLNIELKYEL